jgi:acetyltransferase-like isoleucine patch superfamily enzyme
MNSETFPFTTVSAVVQHLTRHGSAWDRGRRVLAMVRATVIFRHCRTGPGVYAHGHVLVDNQGRIDIGSRCTFVDGLMTTELHALPGAVLSIGAHTMLNYGTRITAHRAIRIGTRCLFASMVELSDRRDGQEAPILIGDDVWIAHGAVINPGVTVGDGAVIGAGSVVVADVPPRTLALGAPARTMKLSLVAPEKDAERPNDEHS